jgi:gamma-glutamyltranspeptidase/glutathione hydrolase
MMARDAGKPLTVGVAASTGLGAEAGQAAIAGGGNAVDAAVATLLLSLTTEPGIVSLASGGFLTLWVPGRGPLVIDGGSEMPGRDAPEGRFGQGLMEVELAYGGGMLTRVGFGSVAVPGILGALEAAARDFGRLPWRELMAPAVEWTRRGFPLSRASRTYLELCHEGIFGWDPDSFRALHDEDGTLKRAGDLVIVEHLSDSLRAIADEGTEIFYRGELGHLIADHVTENGGLLGRRDLSGYRVRELNPLKERFDGWTVATPPPPSVGGVCLAAMLHLLADRAQRIAGGGEAALMADVQRAVLAFRAQHLDPVLEFGAASRRLLALADTGELRTGIASPSTIHASAVDSTGLACSITASAGYGSGVMPPGTGIWLNNCLGELELNRPGFHRWRPGQRLPSNMAPTVAEGPDGRVLAIGSPGADRITTAILQTLAHLLHNGSSLEDAIAQPRLHVEACDGGWRIAAEPGLDLTTAKLPVRWFDEPHMFFGGVSAVLHHADGRFEVAADPRRSGSTALGPES